MRVESKIMISFKNSSSYRWTALTSFISAVPINWTLTALLFVSAPLAYLGLRDAIDKDSLRVAMGIFSCALTGITILIAGWVAYHLSCPPSLRCLNCDKRGLTSSSAIASKSKFRHLIESYHQYLNDETSLSINGMSGILLPDYVNDEILDLIMSMTNKSVVIAEYLESGEVETLRTGPNGALNIEKLTEILALRQTVLKVIWAEYEKISEVMTTDVNYVFDRLIDFSKPKYRFGIALALMSGYFIILASVTALAIFSMQLALTS